MRVLLSLCLIGVLAALGAHAGIPAEVQVRVMDGNVEVVTAKGNLTVEAGRKATMSEDGSAAKALDNPLVEDAIALYKLAGEDRKRSQEDISAIGVQVHLLDKTKGTIAGVAEMPNNSGTAKDFCVIGLTALGDENQFFDLDGNPLRFEFTKETEKRGYPQGYFHVRFPTPVPPGGSFKMIHVMSATLPGDVYMPKPPLWQVTLGNDSKNWLNYFEVILPEAAVFVDCDLPVTAYITRNNRLGVVLRNYTGSNARGHYLISFLWPARDVAGSKAETQVRVMEGKVETVTDGGSAPVEAGLRTQLREKDKPVALPAEPVVEELVSLLEWAATDRLTVPGGARYFTAQVHNYEGTGRVRAAAMAEVPNGKPDATDTFSWGPSNFSNDVKFYNPDGRQLAHDVARITENTCRYSVRFPDKVEPGDMFRFIQVATIEGSPKAAVNSVTRLRKVSAGSGTPDGVDYFNVILPETAILVDWNLAPMRLRSREGRLVVTVRDVTSAQNLGGYVLAFLLPSTDGTSLGDLPVVPHLLKNTDKARPGNPAGQ